jgi:hypothetical protein
VLQARVSRSVGNCSLSHGISLLDPTAYIRVAVFRSTLLRRVTLDTHGPRPLSVVAAISSASSPFVLGLTPCGRCALTPETLPPLSMDGEPTPKPAPLNNFQSPLDRPFHIRTVGAVRRGLGKPGCGHDRPTERHRRGRCGGYAPSTISCCKRVAAA